MKCPLAVAPPDVARLAVESPALAPPDVARPAAEPLAVEPLAVAPPAVAECHGRL